MKIKKLLLLADILIQLLLLVLALRGNQQELTRFFSALFLYQLLSCIIHLEFPASPFRKLYHFLLILILAPGAVFAFLFFIVHLDFALAGLVVLLYGTPSLISYYLLLTFSETIVIIDQHEE
ncbi:MAG: hypothetical protein J7623_17275 [Chitinophaga sp.]|uniref:hypothetical protein n=1 Tax=Chitinophaga sp. TaxID=1869181 RepID=UPI001AFEC3E2|nr:hypothetical protein [Chitinophaga sp.]MBO9730395.1 hypothetical protein [Chitinophaga sp.]